MPFNPKCTITPKINKALVEIKRVRGFLDAVKLKDDWLVDMQKKALILESRHSTHIEGTALNRPKAFLKARSSRASIGTMKKSF